MKNVRFISIGVLLFLASCAMLEDKNAKVEDACAKFGAGLKGDVTVLANLLTSNFGFYMNGTLLEDKTAFIADTAGYPMPPEYSFSSNKITVTDKTANAEFLITMSTYGTQVSLPTDLSLRNDGDMMASKWLVDRWDVNISTSMGQAMKFSSILKR